MWTTDGKDMDNGDPLGDAQIGRAFDLLFTSPEHPDNRVIMTFGAFLDNNDQYRVSVQSEFQEYTLGMGWDIVPGHIGVAHHVSSAAHYKHTDAWYVRDTELDRWRHKSVPDEEFQIG